MPPSHSQSRRTFLASTGAVGIAGLAGCLGGNNDGGDGSGNGSDDGADEDAFALEVATSAGGTWDAGLAFERMMDQHVDSINYSTIEGPGNVANIYRLDEGLFPAAYVDRNALSMAQAGEGGFADEPVETLPWQGFRAFYYNIFLVAREDTDIETYDDLAGKNFFPAEPGYSTRATTLAIMQMNDEVREVYEQMNIMDMDVADAPGAIEEGRVDAMIAYGTPAHEDYGGGMTGFVTEYDARTDIKYVEPTDALIQAAENYAGAGVSYHDPDSFGLENDLEPEDGETFGWDFEVTLTFHNDTPAEVAYTTAEAAYEHVETIREAEPRWDMYGSVEDLAIATMPDYPIHPGVAEYFQDNDVWEDDWIVGEDPGSYVN